MNSKINFLKFIAVTLAVLVVLLFITDTKEEVTAKAFKPKPLMEIENLPFKITTEPAIQEVVAEEVTYPEYVIPLNTELQQFIWDTCNSYGENGIKYEDVIAVLKKENTYMDEGLTHYNEDDGTYDRGLFQLNDETSYRLAGELQIKDFDPYNPYHNIQVAVYYLNTLHTNFSAVCSDEDELMAVACGYNRGGNRAMRDIKNSGMHTVYNNKYAIKVESYKQELINTGTISDKE